jgi:hypothetical protein
MTWIRAGRKGPGSGTGSGRGGLRGVFGALLVACLVLAAGSEIAAGSDPLLPGAGHGLAAEAPPPITVRHPGGTIAIYDLAPGLGLGRKLAPVALAAARALPERIGASLPGQVEVLIVEDAERFRALAHRDPRTILGAARPEAGLAVLNAARLGLGPEANAAGVLRHELAHLALGAIELRHGPFPRWFDEGVASWFAGGAAELGPIDLAAQAGAAELELERLRTSFPEDPVGVSRAYAKSQLAVALIARRIGGDAPHLRPLVAALAQGVPFPEALRIHAGLDETALDRALRDETLGDALAAALTRHAQWVIGVAMAMLAGLGFLARRRRWRRRLAGWEGDRGDLGADGREEREDRGDAGKGGSAPGETRTGEGETRTGESGSRT